MITTIATHQLRLLRRQRVTLAVGSTLIGVTVLAGILGWASHQTIIGVYDEAVRLLASRGLGAPPNPFLLKPQLSMLSNMVIYITLIGALVAIVLGHVSVATDEAEGIGRLVFSRQVSRRQYTVGAIGSCAIVLAIACVACALVSVAALLIVNRTMPSGADLARLAGFYGLSWAYLVIFALIGMLALLIARRRSLGLLSAIGVWLVITFAIPQFTSGLRPAQSLNPIVDPVSTSQQFFRLTARGRRLSIAEQFKEASGRILRTAAPESTPATMWRILPIVGLLVALTAAVAIAIGRHDYSRGAHDD
jgi:ABC-type transport system involved in multi-copper enzyme maturation permease subunit